MVGYQQRLKRAREQGGNSSSCQSCLANHLLLLWGRGEISASALQKLAHAAILDGCQHDELYCLAGLGCYGRHEGNINRDLKTYLEKGNNFAYPHPRRVSTRLKDSKTSIIEDADIYFFRSDDLVSSLYGDPGRFDILSKLLESVCLRLASEMMIQT